MGYITKKISFIFLLITIICHYKAITPIILIYYQLESKHITYFPSDIELCNALPTGAVLAPDLKSFKDSHFTIVTQVATQNMDMGIEVLQ